MAKTGADGDREEDLPAAVPLGASAFALLARRLDECRTLEDVVEAAVVHVVRLLPAARASVGRIEQDTCRTLATEPEPADARSLWLTRRSLRADEHPAMRRLLRNRESWTAHVAHPDGTPGQPGDPALGDAVEVTSLRDLGLSSSLGTPLVVNGTVWGQLSALRGDDLPPFDQEDVARAEVAAALVSGAIARVDLGAQIRHLVADDPLTGLANRRIADDAAAAALESGQETCIVVCDVDGLKRVNDELGHDVGDDLLRTVADVIRRVADALPGTTAARIGGDEFSLVTVGHTRATVAETTHAVISAFPLPHGAAISYGISSTAVTGAVSARHLFRRADAAQYRAKRARARARANLAPAGADPAVTAERVIVAGSNAIAAAQPSAVPRLCALAAVATHTLGGSAWAVLMRRPDAGPDEQPSAVARGGSPTEPGTDSAVVTVQYETWVLEVGASPTAAHGEVVTTALQALTAVAVVGAS
ncbi:diguanylate cyclase domain-containing protein [Cellulomonas soli]|uniref:GGDEF domain-containing protein n=1 Tax=Cellulomonas soli TaxID=931535 RepID=UPI003F82B05E